MREGILRNHRLNQWFPKKITELDRGTERRILDRRGSRRFVACALTPPHLQTEQSIGGQLQTCCGGRQMYPYRVSLPV